MQEDQTLKKVMDELSALKRAEKRAEKRGVGKVALGMIRKGMDNETIAELTELTQEEIEQLRRE